MSDTYPTRLRAALEQLAGQPLRTFSMRLPLRQASVAYIDQIETFIAEALQREEGRSAFQLPPNLRDFGLSVDGFQCAWSLDPISGRVCGRAVKGSMAITSLSQIYAPFDEQWDDDDPQPLDLTQQFYPFDMMHVDYYVTTRFADSTQEPLLYYFTSESHQYYRLRLSFVQYLEAVLHTRGIFRWQELFVDDERFQPDLDYLDLLRCQIAQLFPDADLTQFTI